MWQTCCLITIKGLLPVGLLYEYALGYGSQCVTFQKQRNYSPSTSPMSSLGTVS